MKLYPTFIYISGVSLSQPETAYNKGMRFMHLDLNIVRY